MTRDKVQKAAFQLLIVFLICGIWLVTSMVREAKINDLRRIAEERLLLYQSTLHYVLDKYRCLPFLLSKNGKVLELVAHGENGEFVNRYCADANARAGSAALYVMNGNGVTLASSNWDGPDSYVGHNYGFRPYFRDAMLGKEGGFYAVGATTGIPGYFMSHPIFRQGKPIGAAVVKVDLAGLQKDWLDGGETVFVTDGNGVVFLSSREEWKYKTIVPLTQESLEKIRAGRQYGGADLSMLQMETDAVGDAERIIIDGRKFFRADLCFQNSDWKLHYLLPWSLIEERARGVAFFSASMALFLIVAALFLRERHLRNLSRREAADAEKIREINKKLQSEVEERRKTEASLRETQEELVQAGKLAALGQMSAAIVHELNQPISAIRTYAASCRIMIQRPEVMNDLNRTLVSISGLTDRMAAITGQLKSFSRKSPLKMEKLDLRKPVEAAAGLLKHAVSDSDCRLDKDMADGPQWVMGDALRLEQVFLNLLRNALDAVRVSDEKIICVRMGSAGDFAEVSVSDTGPGIHPEILQRIFDPFFTTKDEGGGLGLGLSISRGIIEDMNGEIRAANGADGAVFTVCLPGYKNA